MMDSIARQPRPLGCAGQQPLRQAHRQTKTRALALHRWAARHGISARSVADHLGIAVQTLSDWNDQRTRRRLDAAPRGRPPHTPSTEVEAQVLELLEERRGRLGLPFLKDAFHDVPRTPLKEIRDRYICEHDGSMEYLTWSVREADANASICAFAYLFAAYGPPLVLKTDNGSHFTDGEVSRALSDAGVTNLLSPPRTPRYNGSEEAGIGSLKTRAFHIAAVHGRPDQWTCDDVEAARIEANIQARPLGKNGPAPIDLWASRTPVADAERLGFINRLAVARAEETEKVLDRNPGSRPASDPDSLGALHRAAVARRAIRRVLIQLGYLSVRRIAN